jgi:hypothetical protein
MKYIITESRLNKFAWEWLNDNYSNLNVYPNHGYTLLIDKNTKGVFSISPNKEVLLADDTIISFLENVLNFDRRQISSLLLKWVNEIYGYKLERLSYNK